MWWAVTTMTTVGYGDLYPHTDEGRFIGVVIMVVGIGFVAVLTAAIAQRFVDVAVHEEVQQAEEALAATDVEVLGEIRAIRRGWKSLRPRCCAAAETSWRSAAATWPYPRCRSSGRCDREVGTGVGTRRASAA